MHNAGAGGNNPARTWEDHALASRPSRFPAFPSPGPRFTVPTIQPYAGKDSFGSTQIARSIGAPPPRLQGETPHFPGKCRHRSFLIKQELWGTRPPGGGAPVATKLSVSVQGVSDSQTADVMRSIRSEEGWSGELVPWNRALYATRGSPRGRGAAPASTRPAVPAVPQRVVCFWTKCGGKRVGRGHMIFPRVPAPGSRTGRSRK
eukprot:gene25866-biopygen22518